MATTRRMTKDEHTKWFRSRFGRTPPAGEYDNYVKATNPDGKSNGSNPNYPDAWVKPPKDTGPTGFENDSPEPPTGRERNLAGGGSGGGAGGALDGTTGGGMTLGDILKKGAGWIRDNPELVLTAIDTYQKAKDSGKADDLRNEAIGFAREKYAEGAPLRDLGMKTALGQPGGYQAPGLASLGSKTANTPALAAIAGNPRNPYSRLNRLSQLTPMGPGMSGTTDPRNDARGNPDPNAGPSGVNPEFTLSEPPTRPEGWTPKGPTVWDPNNTGRPGTATGRGTWPPTRDPTRPYDPTLALAAYRR